MDETDAAAPSIPPANKLNFAERTGRLVLVITVLGALGLGYFKALLFALNNLTTKIYMPHIISHEHIIAACMLSTALLILVHAVWYCYCEFSALNYTNRDDNDSETLRMINKADDGYGSVFKLSPLYVAFSVLTVLLYSIVFGFIVLNLLVMSITLIYLSIFLLLLLFKKFRKEVWKGLALLKRYFVSHWGKLIVWVAVTIVMLAYLFIGMSLSQQAVFTVKFADEGSAPIKINFENTIPEKVTVQFYSVDEGNNEQLTKEFEVTKSEFRRSFIEVTEKTLAPDKISFMTLPDIEMKKGSQAYISRKSHYDFSYEINALDNLKQGKNYVVVQFNTGSSNNSEYYKIVNQIDLDDKGAVWINKGEFQEKLKR